jgi:glyoxylase-like metal-dependent hydrolase (beta-lactamase superfamily II)
MTGMRDMKKILLGLLAVVVVALLALASTFSAATLEVTEEIPITLASPPQVQGVSVSAIYAGRMQSSAAFCYRGGGFTDTRTFGMGGILVSHPAGNLLFDTGFGKDVDLHFLLTPKLMQLTSSYTREPTVAQQLDAADVPLTQISRIVLTHAHWDHVSGIPELKDVSIMTSQEEADYMKSGAPGSELAGSFGFLPVTPFNFREGPYLGFEKSFDVFGDGSVVIVPAPGHTPGAIITFVHTQDGKHYALVGDLVWQKEGIELPAERPWLVRRMVDSDPAAVRSQIVHMHRLQKMMPDLVIVPAHDRRVWDTLPRFPEGYIRPPQ